MTTEAAPERPPGKRGPKRGSLRRSATSVEARRASKDVWDPNLVGVIRSYPKTAAAFEERKARGRAVFERLRAEGRPPSRKGVPDGWGGQKHKMAAAKKKAKRMAREALQKLIEQDLVTETAADQAILVALEIVNDESQSTGDRLKAIKIVTDALKAKPTQKTEVTLNPAEEWLTKIGAA